LGIPEGYKPLWAVALEYTNKYPDKIPEIKMDVFKKEPLKWFQYKNISFLMKPQLPSGALYSAIKMNLLQDLICSIYKRPNIGTTARFIIAKNGFLFGFKKRFYRLFRLKILC